MSEVNPVLSRPPVMKTVVQNCTDEVIVIQFGVLGQDFGEIRLSRRGARDHDYGEYTLTVDAEQTQYGPYVIALMQHAADELALSMLTLTSAIRVLQNQPPLTFDPSL